MEFITYLIGLLFGFKQVEAPVVIEVPEITVVATTTPIKKTTYTFTKKVVQKNETKVYPIIELPATSTATSTPVEVGATASAPIQETVIVVSQPVIEYNIPTTITPTKMEVTITAPVFGLNPTPNSSKYLGTFTVSDTSKKVTMTYSGTSTDGSYTKGGLEYAPNQPYNVYWELLGTFNYEINYNNGETTKEGTFTVTE